MDFNEAANFATYESKENSIQKRGKYQAQMLRNAKSVATGRGSFEECYWPGLPPAIWESMIAIPGPPDFWAEALWTPRGLTVCDRSPESGLSADAHFKTLMPRSFASPLVAQRRALERA